MAVFSMAGSNPALPTYPLQRSVRLRSSASAYFNRTLTTATDSKIWTWSSWIKIGGIPTYNPIFAAGTTGSAYAALWFNNGTLVLYAYTGATVYHLVTTQVFRDPSAWYHIQVAFNSTEATSTNRVKIYVNGVQVTAFSTATYPSLNYATYFNTAVAHNIGQYTPAGVGYFDGYLTEVNFIDGQALTPSSFGAYNSYGVWSPAKYTGTYGTNGFYLNFQDNSALTTTANVGIGKDSSGNGNYWTSNNISITAGTTYDSMLDVPTLTSPTNANFAVLNPVAGLASGSSYTITQANLYAVLVSGASVVEVPATMELPTTGQWYWEVNVVSVNTTYAYPLAIGISSQGGIGTAATFTNNYYYYTSKTGNKFSNGTSTAYGATFTANDVIGVAFDASAGTLTFYKNNTSQGTAYTSLSGTFYPKFSSNDGCTIAVNFGQRPFSYTPPTGFNRLCTYNLPDSIVPVGAQYFAATTYTGNGVATPNALVVTNTVNGKSFQPDFVWVKSRSLAQGHVLEDSVRGTSVFLQTDTTAADQATGGGDISSFNSNGFTLSYGNARTNQNAATYVGWQWRASNASAVSNTSGSITSQVSANQTAGFSIVTYTGTGANTTVGHGLGVAPKMVIIKTRSNITNWVVWQTSLSGLQYLNLDQTNAVGSGATVWNSAIPTSTVINLGTDVAVNGSGRTNVAYCFAAVPGYSAFGSYTGNGSADGPFVYTGFRPRWIMAKRTDTTGDWVIWDTSRNTYNVAENGLYPNLSVAEGNSYFIDVLSNGFKLRMSTIMNVNSGTYIYAAFSENPFKNSLAR